MDAKCPIRSDQKDFDADCGWELVASRGSLRTDIAYVR